MARMRRGYDLHTHSVHSDGTTTPGEIAREAAALGLDGFALTDHDTTSGWDEARAACAEEGIDFLPGIEITTKDGYRSPHLLAYGLDLSRGGLLEELAAVRDSRLTRARQMVRLLSADFDIRWDAVLADGDERTVGRPHIADALVGGGYFADRGAAFAGVLSPGSAYYIPTYAIDTADAIRLVLDAGGVPVLAHPAAARQRSPVSASAIERFALAGLRGIELDHPENRAEWLPELRAFAVQHGLVVTGSSDFHGAGKPNRLGERRSSAEVFAWIREQAAIPE